ncbi:hypothetical protein MKW92_001650 [Papaver armeniacum]|nr:hypothetical protein MKW92_001650 [Papaver armeniacum]
MLSNKKSWTVDSELDGIDLTPEDFNCSVPLKKVPTGDIFSASRAGDVERVEYLIETGVNINERDKWDSVALYYACLAGHLDVARMLLENGAICSEHTFDGDRCHYSALNLKVRKLLKAFEARPPPLLPLQSSLRDTFLSCRANQLHLEQHLVQPLGPSQSDGSNHSHFPPDVVFFVHGRPIEAHRIILSARSPFFKKNFETIWRDRREVRLAREKLSYPALYSLFHFFYSDRLEIAVDDMEDLVRICKVCKCEELQRIWDYKALRDIDNSQKRFILQGQSLPEKDRLPAALHQILQTSLAKSNLKQDVGSGLTEYETDLADVCIRVGERIFRCHQVIFASRSEYFKARLSRMTNFLEGKDGLPGNTLPVLQEHDLSTEAFEKMIEYMYTDCLKDIDPDQAEEMFDAASRYLLFPLKRAVADVLLPHLEMVSPHGAMMHIFSVSYINLMLFWWFCCILRYGILKIREYCLDLIACNFETFADTREFRAMLLTLPPPSEIPPGLNTDQGNLLGDLREKWLESEARLVMLMTIAERECTDDHLDGI